MEENKFEFNYDGHFETWSSFISNNKHLTKELEKAVTELRNGQYKRVFPSGKDIFRCFRETTKDDIQYVLLGMDPYNNTYKGVPSACGLCFVTENGYVNPSLKILCENLKVIPCDFKKFMLDRKVLLLNSYLTVEEHLPGSHKKLWSEFSKVLITSISKMKPNLTWILLGNDAKAYRECIADGNILTELHPSALAHRGQKGKYDGYQRLFKELKWI